MIISIFSNLICENSVYLGKHRYMKIVIEKPFAIDAEADAHIRGKFKGLEEYKMGITQIDLYFKIDDGDINKTAVAEIEIHLPGPVIFASDRNPTYKKAFTGAFNKAKSQLLKKKEILKSH